MAVTEPGDKPVEHSVTALMPDTLVKLFAENWSHIRHMEYYRMWCVNIYALITACLVGALSTGKLEPYFGYAATFLMMFAVFNLLIAIKIEAVVDNFVKANEKIVGQLGTDQSIAPVRTRTGVWDFIRFQWLFPVFYGLALAGTLVLVCLHYRR